MAEWQQQRDSGSRGAKAADPARCAAAHSFPVRAAAMTKSKRTTGEGANDEQINSDSNNGDGIRHRQRQTQTQTEAQTAASAPAATAAAPDAAAAASAAASATGASLIHANQSLGSSSSSAHICSNTGGCPLISQWTALPPSERDSLPLSEELFACSQCRSVLYCSRDCQRHHWLEGGHKAACPTLAAKHAQEDGQTAASSVPAPGAAPAPGASAVAPRRAFNINLSIALGPRALIVFVILIYLIYRYRLAPASGISAAPPAVH